MQGHAADAAALGHRGRDLAGTIQQEHAAIEDIAEIKAPVGIPNRAFDQAVAGCPSFHAGRIHPPASLASCVASSRPGPGPARWPRCATDGCGLAPAARTTPWPAPAGRRL